MAMSSAGSVSATAASVNRVMPAGGSNSVTVSVTGTKGVGTVVVPVVVVAYSRLTLDKPMGAALATMGIFLFAGLVTIVGAGVRED